MSRAQLLLAGIAKARPWFAGFTSPVPEVVEALAEGTAALDKLETVVSKSVDVAGFAHHEEPEEIRHLRAAAEKKLSEIVASDEQISRRRENRSR